MPKRKYVIEPNIKDFVVLEESRNYLRELNASSNFALYKLLLKRRFVNEFSKLRKKDADRSYIDGYLSGIEYALSVLDDETIKGTDNNPE